MQSFALLAAFLLAEFGTKEGSEEILTSFVPGVADRIFLRLDRQDEKMAKQFERLEGLVKSLSSHLAELKQPSQPTQVATGANLVPTLVPPAGGDYGTFKVFEEDFFSKLYPRGHNGFAGGFGNVISAQVNSRVKEFKAKFPLATGDAKVPRNHHVEWMNDLPIAKLRQDAAVAMSKYIEKSGQQEYFKDHTQPGDVVLHYRCGDIVQLQTSNGEYGLLPFSWLHQHIPKGSKRVFVTGNFGVMSGSSKTSMKDSRKIDSGSEARCSYILDALLAYLRRQTGGLTVEFVSKDTITDLLLMARAPTLIGSVSTFSLWGAAMSKGLAILPHASLWSGVWRTAFDTSLRQGAPERNLDAGTLLFGPAGAPGTVEIVASACLKSSRESESVFRKSDPEIVQLLEQPVQKFGQDSQQPYSGCR
jgi:hypothetical protein